MLIKYIKSILWRVAKRMSYIEDAQRLKVKQSPQHPILKRPQPRPSFDDDSHSHKVRPKIILFCTSIFWSLESRQEDKKVHTEWKQEFHTYNPLFSC